MWLSAWPHRRPRWDFDAVLSGIPPRDKLLKHTDETYLNITKFLWLFFCPCDVRTSFEFSQIPPRIIISRQTGRFLPPSLSFAIRKKQSVLSAFRVPPPRVCNYVFSYIRTHTVSSLLLKKEELWIIFLFEIRSRLRIRVCSEHSKADGQDRQIAIESSTSLCCFNSNLNLMTSDLICLFLEKTWGMLEVV